MVFLFFLVLGTCLLGIYLPTGNLENEERQAVLHG